MSNQAQPATQPRAPAAGKLVAFCGLHGGAGTTRLATLLATAAATPRPAKPVALIETDPAGGGLAHATGVTSPRGLSDHARTLRTTGPPDPLQLVTGPEKTRVMAAAPAPRSPAALHDVAAVFEDLRAQHGLVVVDAGTLREPHAQPALLSATHVIWVLATGADVDHARGLLASPLSRAASGARQSILVNRTRPDKPRSLRAHRELTDTAHQLILTPQLTDPQTHAHVGAYLLTAIT